jgi:hypothetical protein
MGNTSHFGIKCAPSELNDTLAFYLNALKPLGYKEIIRPVDQAVGLGNSWAPEFWIVGNDECDKVPLEQRKRMALHYAFYGKDHRAVHDFHKAAIQAGAKCNGKPGYRPQYFRYYYASFVIDPLGNNVEVMTASPAWTQLWWWMSWLPGCRGLEPVEKEE